MRKAQPIFANTQSDEKSNQIDYVPNQNIWDKIQQVKQIKEEIAPLNTARESVNVAVNGNTKKKSTNKIGMKLLYLNLIIGSVFIIVIVFHLKGYF